MIKDLLKYPFVRAKGKTDGVNVYMKKSYKHRGMKKEPTRLLNIVRDNLCWLFWDDDGAKTYNQIIDWVVSALNEKYIRDFGIQEKHGCEKCEHWDSERLLCKDDYNNPCPSVVNMQWEKDGDLFICPKCNLTSDFNGVNINDLLYCPKCKTRLSLPENNK
jgi:hypothetical protein